MIVQKYLKFLAHKRKITDKYKNNIRRMYASGVESMETQQNRIIIIKQVPPYQIAFIKKIIYQSICYPSSQKNCIPDVLEIFTNKPYSFKLDMCVVEYRGTSTSCAN